jgi:LysM domain
MSVMSVSQRPGATGRGDKAGERDDRELPGRSAGRPPSGRQPQASGRLERELRSRGPLAREPRAHRALTGDLRTRWSLVPEPRPGGLRGRAPGAPGASGVAPGQRGHGVRLTRRGRLAIVGIAAGLVLAVVAALWLAAATGVQAANHGLAPAMVYKSMTPVVVQPGQTLWTIALRAEPAADPRIVISQIMEFNALSSDVVVPGERLWVPKS